jgi:hypothetical protein
MKVQMTDQSIPYRLQELCAGNIQYAPALNPKRKPTWIWQIGANGVRWLLPQIAPYLLVKKRHADLTIEFLTLVRKGTPRRGEHNPRAQEIRALMAKLNQRGMPHGGILSEPLITIAESA